MNRNHLFTADLLIIFLLVPILVSANPYIINITPSRTSANTGATIDITGTHFGSMDDLVGFPSKEGTDFVNPIALIPDGVRVRVPATWSGDVYVVETGDFTWSQPYFHEISFSYMNHRWPNMSLTWYLNENGAPDCNFNSVQAALESGYETWSCASEMSTFYGGTTAINSISQDGVNCRFWSNSGWEDHPSVIAMAAAFFDTAAHAIIESDIIFNSQYFTWSTNGAIGDMDVASISTHEEGHSLGLLDLYGTEDFEKTMYGVTSGGSIRQRTLTYADAEGVEFMYPHDRANQKGWVPSGWTAAIVPRNTNNASHSSCDLPYSLGGNTTTYINVAAINNGYDCMSPSGDTDIYVDGEIVVSPYWNGVWNPDVELSFRNQDFEITGGRHTLMANLDPDNCFIETNAYDNVYEAQYVWSPFVLADQTPVLRDPPPDRGYLTYPNCDGFEFSAEGKWWAVVGVVPLGLDDEYDLRLHNESPHATGGFDSYVAASTMSGPVVDFVLINGNTGGGANITRWVGQNRWSGGYLKSYVEMCQSMGTLSPPVETPNHTLAPTHIVKMHEVYLEEGGDWEFTLNNISGGANLGFALYSASSTNFGRQDFVAQGNYYGSGENEMFTFTPTETGYYGLVVYKNDRDDRSLDSTYSLDIRETPPNLTYSTAVGWDYPIVPRNDDSANIGNVHLSSILDGEAYNTYVSLSGINDGPAVAASAHTNLYVDETFYTYLNWGSINPGQPFQYYNYGPLLIGGGRHTVEWRIDEANEVDEFDELDNNCLQQFVWSPLVLTNEVPVNRPVPPVRGSGAIYNMDGFSQTPNSQFAWVTASCPLEAGDDYDLAVFNNYAGPESGFSDFFDGSSMGPGMGDYVGGSYLTAGQTRYPAVVRFSGGNGHFIIDTASSSNHLAASLPVFWMDEELPTNRMVDIFEAHLTSGESYILGLENNSGGANLDIFAHRPSATSLDRSQAEFIWMSQGPGMNEEGVFVPSETGYYVFVVQKFDYSDLPLNAHYNLSITQSVTAVNDQEVVLPTAFALLGNYPNPFNPRTEISFDIPTSGTSVHLEIYDLSGRRVRILANQIMPAGHHRLQWNGRNDRGETQNSGTYFYQLRAGSFTQTGKMTLLK